MTSEEELGYNRHKAIEHDPVTYTEAKRNATEKVVRLAEVSDIAIDAELRNYIRNKLR